MIVKINTDIKWNGHKYGNILFSDGMITLTEDSITVSVSLTRDEAIIFSSAHPACLDVHEDLRKNMEYSNCQIDGEPVVLLDMLDVYVDSFRMKSSQTGHSLEWTLSFLSYKFKSKDAKEFHIVNAPFIHLVSHFVGLDLDLQPIELDFDDFSCIISETDNSNYSKISQVPGKIFDNDLYSLLSLYVGCPISVVVDFSINDMGDQCVSWRPTGRCMNKETLRNYELAYIQIGDSNRLENFLKKTNWREKSEKDKGLLKQAIYTYVNSKYLPYPLQFLTIYSVLERFLGSEKGKEPYGVMQKKLPRYGINISKIGKVNESEIRKLGLVLERDTKPKSVTNFCDLRNYIMHFMMNPEIEEYLDRAELVSKMKFAVVIILLKELGFRDCCFKKDWKYLSILI